MTITLRRSLNAKEVEAIQYQADPYSFYFLCTLFFMRRFSYMTTCLFLHSITGCKISICKLRCAYFLLSFALWNCVWHKTWFGIDETDFDKSYLDTFGKYFGLRFLSFVTAEIRLKFATETNIGEFIAKYL